MSRPIQVVSKPLRMGGVGKQYQGLRFGSEVKPLLTQESYPSYSEKRAIDMQNDQSKSVLSKLVKKNDIETIEELIDKFTFDEAKFLFDKAIFRGRVKIAGLIATKSVARPFFENLREQGKIDQYIKNIRGSADQERDYINLQTSRVQTTRYLL